MARMIQFQTIDNTPVLINMDTFLRAYPRNPTSTCVTLCAGITEYIAVRFEDFIKRAGGQT